jgi:crossover junction endodeoxyribonuclease RusA
MIKQLEYQLPWPPSLNRAWRYVDGRVLLSALGRNYYVKIVNALPKGPTKPLKGRLRVTYLLHPPEALTGRWDIANREKVLSDALTKAGVWADDSQIDVMLIERREIRTTLGSVIVKIEEGKFA